MDRLIFATVLMLASFVAGTARGQGDPAELTAVEAAAQIRAGTLTSEALVSALAVRIERGGQFNAFISFDRDAALAKARDLDRLAQKKQFKGPLHGVPIVVKDNIHVAGFANTAGTPALKGFRPSANAPVIEALVNAGAIIIGKTNLHELAFGITSNNAQFGAVANAYDPTRFAGGSSGGNGAAIALRMAPAGIGSDTGGSVRIPAALNGIAGLRPTKGRYSTEGVTPISTTRDTLGSMARSFADLALLDGVITGSKGPTMPANLERIRIGVERAYFFNNLDTETAELTERALWRLKAEGAEIVEIEMPGLADLMKMALPIPPYEAQRAIAAYLEKYRAGVDLAQLTAQIASPDVKAVFENAVLPGSKGAPSDAAYRDAMHKARPGLAALYAQTFRKYRISAIAFPTTVAPAQPIKGADRTFKLNGQDVPTFPTFTRNMGPGTIPGVPSITVPIARTGAGLPIGLTLDGPMDSDRRLLALGMALEKVYGILTPP
ncbi:MAG: indoleacetamide hydrolase [Betaproteobacteria bacterium]|nr:indoleacetamide hydrolase [Betaproteobacteria bacterium]